MFFSFMASTRAQTTSDTDSQAVQILQQNCGNASCHGGPSGYSFDVYDPASLIAAKVVEPGNAAGSELIQRVEAGIMPMGGYRGQRGVKLPAESIQVLRLWIGAGAHVPALSSPPPRRFISEAQVSASIIRDLDFAPETDRPYLRYFTMTNLWNNAEIDASELDVYRAALDKLLNHLSWQRDLTPAKRMGPNGTISRVDLRDYDWTEYTWQCILDAHPYAEAPGDFTPYIRADWFIATASKPPLYHSILRLPNTLAGLEELLHVDSDFDLQHDLARRFGLRNSGVSRNNRAMERHATVYGAYWKSFDFGGNNPEQNIFRNPVDLRPDGGEVIFHLPNGLQGYFIVDRQGRRIDEAPVNIVRDKTNPDDPVVHNGRSCIGCHFKGMNSFRDETAGSFEGRSLALFDIDHARSLYRGQPELEELLNRDNRRFAAALAGIGAVTPAGSDSEPINQVARKYEAALTTAQAAADLYLESARALQERLAASDELQTEGFAQLLGPKGGIKRDAWEEGFGRLRLSLEPIK
jgi:hypothetical protein